MKEIRAVAVFVFRIDKGEYSFYIVKRGKNMPNYPSTWTPIASILSVKDEEMYQKLLEKHGDISENMLDKSTVLRLLLERDLIIDPELNVVSLKKTDIREKILEMDQVNLNVLFHSMVPFGFRNLLVDESVVTPNYYLFISPASSSKRITKLSQYSDYQAIEDNIREVEGRWFKPSKIIQDYEKLKQLFDPAITTLMYKFFQEKMKLVEVARKNTEEKSPLVLEELGFLPYIWRFKTPAHTQQPFSESNIYVIGNERKYIIDPGSTIKKNIAELTKFIEKNLENIEGILISNSFADHVNQALFYREEYNLPLHASKKTAQVLEKDGFVFNSYLKEGDKILVGSYEPLGIDKWELEIINLPGYTEGQIGFYDPRGVLFASSLFHKDMISAIDSYSGVYSDLIQSYDKISKLKIKYALSGHRDVIADIKSQISYNLKQFHKYEKIVVEELKSGKTNRDVIMKSVQSIAQYKWDVFARNVTDVILAKLSEKKKVSKRGQDFFWLKNTVD